MSRNSAWIVLVGMLFFVSLQVMMATRTSLRTNRTDPPILHRPISRIRDKTSLTTSGIQNSIQILMKKSKTDRRGDLHSPIPPPSENDVVSSLFINDLSASSNPLIHTSDYQPKSSQPLRVIFIGNNNGIWMDALDRSKYIKVIQTIDYDVIMKQITRHRIYHSNPSEGEHLLVLIEWMVLQRDCHALQHVWNLANLTSVVKSLDRATIAMIDQSASTTLVSCPIQGVVELGQSIRQARRGVVEGRYWNATRQWVETGHLVRQDAGVIHSPYFLREAFVDELLEQVSSLEDVPRHSRKADVAMLWKKGDYGHYSFLRRFVGTAIQEFDKKVSHIRWVVRRFEATDEEGWHPLDINPQYVTEMISSKIVVVAQRDEWEDHYRLLEAMASGALVLSDTMLAPLEGLQNGTNIVFYDSVESLYNAIKYYLKKEKKRKAIARAGMEFALGQHRSWHAAERLVFGRPLTMVNEPFATSPARKHASHHRH